MELIGLIVGVSLLLTGISDMSFGHGGIGFLIGGIAVLGWSIISFIRKLLG